MGSHVFVGEEATLQMEPRSLGRATMPTPTPWVTNAPPTREEPTFRGVVSVLGNLVGSRARVVANGVARDLTMSSRALTVEGLPDRQTTNLLRFWFVVAAGVVGFLLASTLANGVGMASTIASSDNASPSTASRAPLRHEMTGGTRVLIVTPLVMATSRTAAASEPARELAPPPPPMVVAPPPPVVRAVPVVAKAPPPPPAKAPVVVKAPPPPPPAAPPPSNKSLFSDALK